jgi:hypothetical protein
MKTKRRCGKLARGAGMCMKTKHLAAKTGNSVEKKAD